MLELKILPYRLNKHKRRKSTDKSLQISDPPPDDNYVIKPITSSYGQIKIILITLPKDNKAELKYNFFPVLKELINKMTDQKKIIIAYRGDEFDIDPELKEFINSYSKDKIELIKTHHDDVEMSIWAQDHFYPLLLQNKEEKEDTKIYWAMGNRTDDTENTFQYLFHNNARSANAHNIIVQRTNLPFDGGNILVDKIDDSEKGHFVLVGQNHHNINYKSWFGVDPIFVKTNILPPQKKVTYTSTKDGFINVLPFNDDKNQPLFHIDMFLTLAGFNKDRSTYNIVFGCPTLALENLDESDMGLYSFITVWLDNIKKSIESCICLLKQDLENVLQKTLKQTVEVKMIPTPLVLTYQDRVTDNSRIRDWFWATYSNCLVETSNLFNNKEPYKKVWTPSYGIKTDYTKEDMDLSKKNIIANTLNIPLESIKYGNWSNLKKYDTKNCETWTKLGFKVCPLEESYLQLTSSYGALNCITNCIKRI